MLNMFVTSNIKSSICVDELYRNAAELIKTWEKLLKSFLHDIDEEVRVVDLVEISIPFIWLDIDY